MREEARPDLQTGRGRQYGKGLKARVIALRVLPLTLTAPEAIPLDGSGERRSSATGSTTNGLLGRTTYRQIRNVTRARGSKDERMALS